MRDHIIRARLSHKERKSIEELAKISGVAVMAETLRFFPVKAYHDLMMKPKQR